LQPALDHAFAVGSPFGRALAGVDLDQLRIRAREYLDEKPRTRAELARLLVEDWPDKDGLALAYGVTYQLPLAQITPRGEWGLTGAARWAPLEGWLGRPLERSGRLDDLVLRYLAAFGPAGPRDLAAW